MFKVKDKYNIAIVGATGIVGESLLDIISFSRKFPTLIMLLLLLVKGLRAVKVKFGRSVT